MSAWDVTGAVFWGAIAMLSGMTVFGLVATPGKATEVEAKIWVVAIPLFVITLAACAWCIARLNGAHL